MPPEDVVDLPADEVAIHSRQKHALLEAYLRVWTQNVATNWATASPSLDIFDLFAGTGWGIERDYRKDQWPGTALISGQQLKQYPSQTKRKPFVRCWEQDNVVR